MAVRDARWVVVCFAIGLALLPGVALAQGKPGLDAVFDARPLDETEWGGATAWSDGENRDWSLRFRSDGVLIYGYDGASYDNGRWRQRERLVTFHTNDYYALYAGVIEGDRMSGTMYNKDGLRGTWSFTRQ